MLDLEVEIDICDLYFFGVLGELRAVPSRILFMEEAQTGGLFSAILPCQNFITLRIEMTKLFQEEKYFL